MDHPIDRRDLMRTSLATGLLAAAAPATRASAERRTGSPPATPAGSMDLAFTADAPTTPTGLAIDARGRAFLFMPRFDDQTRFSIGLVGADGSVAPWPDMTVNLPDPKRPAATLFQVPNGVFDAAERLWVLDAGLMAGSGTPMPGAPKLVCFDASGKMVRSISLDTVVTPTSSLNDLRVRPDATAAFITDQGQKGQGAVIAVDLATGRAVRRLGSHPSTASTPGILKIVEGKPVMKRGRDGKASPVQGGANGIALSPDGRRLYYAPLMGRHLFSVDTAALLDPSADDAAVAATVQDLGEKGMTGGLIADARDRVWLSLQEFNAVGVREPTGEVRVVASDPRLIWPDTFVIRDGWLYISSSQVNRRADFNGGADRQVKPYAVLRMRLPG